MLVGTDIEVRQGDCLPILRSLPDGAADLVYLDPPFFTQREHRLSSRDRVSQYSFDDRWQSIQDYTSFLRERLVELRRLLKPTGSIFFHCDRTASHLARMLLDEIFQPQNFRSEIIWHYRRWSNSMRGLLPAHQNILFYSVTDRFRFNTTLTDYSPTTNVDQILQKRSRDAANKSVYSRDTGGNVVYAGAKYGVPLSDVWEIPFLNPKAKERIGYPTQKPLLLLERIISLVTDPGDLVIDPFCGSGTALVAAKLLKRRAVGIDCSPQACALATMRLDQPIRTKSKLLESGPDSFRSANPELPLLLGDIPYIPVQRNSGIDALLKATYRGMPIAVRVQKKGECLTQAARALHRAASAKQIKRMILIATEEAGGKLENDGLPSEVLVIDSPSLSIRRLLSQPVALVTENPGNRDLPLSAAST